MDMPEFNFRKDEESDDFVASVVHQLYTKIVEEEDEYTMKVIEDYVNAEKAKGHCIAAKIIPEGKLRHIINLGLTRFNSLEHCDLKPGDLFPQEQYIEHLKRQIVALQQENQKLKNQINIIEGGNESEEI